MPSGRAVLVAILAFGLLGSTTSGEQDSTLRRPMDDAVAVWHFGDGRDAAGRFPLAVKGAVTLGVELEGADRAASLARGGDGRVARFDGGYLAIDRDQGVLNLPGQALSIAVRIRDPEGTWQSPLFGSYGSDRTVSYYLRAVDGRRQPMTDRNLFGGELPTTAAFLFGSENGPRSIRGSKSLVEFVWGAQHADPPRVETIQRAGDSAGTRDFSLCRDTQNAVQRVCYPVQGMGPTDWHDVVIRFTGPKLQLFVDGVLVDEEFPVGQTRQNRVPCLIGAAWENGAVKSGFRGLIDHAAVWNRAISDAEVASLCGGAEQVRTRELAILGPMPSRMQYFRPRGHNSKAGDCIPFFHDGTYHLFYLILRRNMHSKWDGGHGGLEIHHASTKDLVTWTHHPVVAPITEQWEAWNGTGGVVQRNGVFHWFYPTPCYNPQWPYGGIQLTVSTDGEHFVKQSPHPFLPGGDCEVFADPDPSKKAFHLVKEGRLIGGALPAIGDKTLVAWVSPATLDQRGGSVLTIEGDGGVFDAIVLGEALPRRWMAGSDSFQRTQRDQSQNAEESAGPNQWVQLACVYAGNSVTLYRDGLRYASYTVDKPHHFLAGARLLIGLRHVARRGEPNSHFRGAIADARLFDRPLSQLEVRQLRPHEPAGVKPLVWFDFRSGGASDRMKTLAPADLEGDATVADGKLVLGGGNGCLLGAGKKMTLAHLVSEDLRQWKELPEPFLVADAGVVPQMCPHWFAWNDWYYFIGGVNGIWMSRQPFGPWTRHPTGLDVLGVPKTAAFGGNRRIYAGFLSDGGWGGNLVLRELVQAPDGTLGTRFVREMIPRTAGPLPLRWEPGPGANLSKDGPGEVILDAGSGPARAALRDVPQDVRITLEIVPGPKAKALAIGLRGRTRPEECCRLEFSIPGKSVGFSQSTDSSQRKSGGPTIGDVSLDKPIRLDIICRHDILDAEINGHRTIVNRYWDADGSRVYLTADRGDVTFRKIEIRPLVE